MAFESEHQTDRDMSLERNVQEATWRLERCQTPEEYQTWAKSYGRPLLLVADKRVPHENRQRDGGPRR